MDEKKSADESPRVTSEPPATFKLDDVNAAAVENVHDSKSTEEKVDKLLPDCDESEIPSEPSIAQNELQDSKKLSKPEAENISKNVEDDEKKQFVVGVNDATKKTKNDDDDDPHEMPREILMKKTQNENENKNENDKINSTSDETINKTVSSSNDESNATNENPNLPSIAIPTSTTSSNKSEDENRGSYSNCSTLKISSTTSSSTISAAVEESKNDVKLEIDSGSLLDRVILYSLKNTVVDNSRLDAVKTRYLNNASGSSSTLPTNNNSQQTNIISNKGSDNSCNLQQQQSNSKSVNEVIEEFKSCTKVSAEWPYSNNNNNRTTSDKSDRHDEPSTKGAEKVYTCNDSNNVTKENVAREIERRECDKNVIFIPKGAERSSSYKRDFISENSHLPPPRFPLPQHVKRVESEAHSAYKFNNPAQHQQQRPLNTYDNSYHTNTNRHLLQQERIVNENSFLKRDPTSLSSMSTASLLQQQRDEEKTVIKQTRAPCMRLPDFSKRNFDTSSASVNNRVAVSGLNSATMQYENAVFMEAQQMKSFTKEPSTSSPHLTSLKIQPPDFAEVIRRNNYISDLQLKPPETSTSSSAAKYSYSHTPPPLHYNDSNYSPSPYHFNHHLHARSLQQPHIAPSLSKMPTVTAHKTPTSSYELPPRESSQMDEPMAHIINKNHHLIALKGEPSSQSQHNFMRSNESGMKPIYSSSLPPHHLTPPPPLQSQPNHHVLNSHNQTVSVIRDSTTMRDSHQQQQENERRMRINNYTNELRNHPAEQPPHFYANTHPSHSFSLKQKEDQLRQEGTIITLKTELNIVRNYDDRRSSTEVIREIHQSKPHESLDIRRTTYHISHQGYPQPHHGQESNYQHDNDPRANMLASPRHEINPTPPYFNNSLSNERYPAVNPLRSAMNRFGNSNELQVYDKQSQMIGRSKTASSDEYQQLRREFVQPHPPPPLPNFTSSRYTSQIPPQQKHPTTDYRNLPEGYPYPRPPPVVPVINNYPPQSPNTERQSSVLRVNKEVKFVPEVPSDPLPSTSTTIVKKESPLDLSVKTVKTKADSTGCDQDKKSTEPKSLKIEFNPDFSRAAVPPAPVNFSINKMRPTMSSTPKSHENSYPKNNEFDMPITPHFPSPIASYETSPRVLPNSLSTPQDHGKSIMSKIEPPNGLNIPHPPHSPFFQPSPSSSSFPMPPQHDKRPPLTFKEEMFSKTPTPYRKPFSRISLEEERKLDRMYVEQMLHGKGGGREPPPPPNHRFPHKYPLEPPIEMSRMMPPKPFPEPLHPKDQIIAIAKHPQHAPMIHHFPSNVIPSDFSKEIIERKFVNSETRLEPVAHISPPIPYNQNITVKTETEKCVDEIVAKVTSVITKSTMTNITVSPTILTHEPGNSIHRGAEESTILKLKTNLEQKKIMLNKNEVSEYQEQMQTATTSMMSANENNNAAVVSPRQFRTKGELKGFVQTNESINLLDWGNACHGFMQQLETGGNDSSGTKKKRPLKSTNENKASTSDDEDKPLVKLFKKEDDEVIATATATVVTSAEGNLRQFREMQRIELERKIAARLGNPSSSESESELKKSSLRFAKRRIRKLRKRETLGMTKTDEEQTFEEIESDVAAVNHTKPAKHSKLDNLTSSDEDEAVADPTNSDDSKRKKECQERRSSRSSVSNSGKKKETPRNSQSTSVSATSKPANDLKQLGISSELDKLIDEGKTMTRSKRKLEIEKKLSNSKVLRNDKVVRNDLCVKKMRNASNNNVNKIATTKKSDSPKRKLDETDNSKEAIDKKKLKKNESQSTNESSDSENQKSDTEQSNNVANAATNDDGKKPKKNVGENSAEKPTKLSRNSTPKSSFEPGWETETYKFKKSMRIPAGLITIAGKSKTLQAAKSLPDLDHQMSDASETFLEASKVNHDKVNGNESKMKELEKYEKRKSSSIIDLLHQRFVQLPRKIRSRKSDNKKADSSLVDDFGLLPTPEKESDKVFGFKKNIFESSIITSRTRNENSSNKKKELLREVFGIDDERPKSAPPGGNVDLTKEKVEEKISYDQKYREYLLKMDVDFTVKQSRDVKIDTTSTKATASKSDVKDESEEEAEVELEKATPNLLTVVKKKSRTRRLKGSSGFDYIRKKKKATVHSESQINLSNNIIKKRLQARENLETKDESDIAKEIKGWVLNKGVGESVLHKASRLNYMDVIAFCLERLNMNPDMKDNAGYTPLHEACSRGHLDVAQILLLYGANHSETALSGIRPLHEAIENGHVEIVRLLISYGADPCLATYSGQLPINMAEDEEMENFLRECLKDLDNKHGSPTPWTLPGPYHIEDNSFDNICNVLHDPPCSMHEVESSIASVYSTSLTSLVTATTQLSDAETVMTESTASLIKEPIQDVMKYPHRMLKNDSNSNNLIMTDLSKQKSRSTSFNSKHNNTKRSSKKKTVLDNNNSSSTTGNITTTLKTKQDQKMSSNIKNSDDFKSAAEEKFECMDHDSDNDIFELEESDIPLPPVYLLKDEGAEKWILLTDLCSLLKVKSKEAVLKQISPLSPSSACKEMIRELKMTDFLQKASCLQLFCAGEKINVRASKISLIRYNESVKNLLGVETIRMNM